MLEQFKMDLNKTMANPKNVIQGSKYRFTVLTERLIRLEYNEKGIFEDRPTSLVISRDTDEVKFTKKEDGKYLVITTSFFRITYVKEKPLYSGKLNSMKYFKAELLNSEKIWYFGHPEVRNYGAPILSLDDNKGKLKFKKGLYSTDGFASIDDSINLVINESGVTEERVPCIDTYLFMYLNSYADCLKDYYAITGSPALVPRYSLGNWWSRNIKYDDNSLKELVDNFDFYDIPMSVLLLDKDWHYREFDNNIYKSGFSWNQKYFSRPSSMIDYLHAKGIRLGLNINPKEGLFPYEDKYEDLSVKFPLRADGSIEFNVLSTECLTEYFNLLIHPLDNVGVDFYWFDDLSKKQLKDNWLINHYQFMDMTKNYKARPLILSRNNGVAAHRYPIQYSGKSIVDWKTLKMLPFYNLCATNIGVSFIAHDIGGYYKGTEDNELYTRYVQLGVFSPILKFGADQGKYYKREPWKWSVKTYTIVKDYLNLRHKLIPYLYAEAYKYSKDGIPLITPLYYKYPEMYDDENYRNGYYFGSEMYVAPIINKKDYVMNRSIHKFFMPEGIWYDYFTGKKFPGGKDYISFFRDQDYPVFAKAGAIIPLGINEDINSTNPSKNMEIQIFPGRSNTYKMYEDDGISNLYKKDYFLETEIDYNYMPNNYTVILRPVGGKKGIVPDERDYKFVFRNTKKANDVIVYLGGVQIKSASYVEGTSFIVEVKDIPTTEQLTLNCKGKDIEIDAVRIINDDVESIISDLQIETRYKEMIDEILFSDLTIRKKRIGIRKLKRKGLERKFIKLFLKILEYIEEV